MRDPRSIAASLKETPWGNKCVGVTVRIWNKSIKAIYNFVDDDRVKIIKYEDLVQNPEDVIKDICNFVNIEFHKDMIYRRTPLAINQNKLGWTSKYEMEVGRSINPESINKWMKKLTAFEISILEMLCKKAFDDFEYIKKYSNPKFHYMPLFMFQMLYLKIKQLFSHRV